MEFKVTVDMQNAAFDDGPATELSRILKALSKAVQEGADGGNVFDLNGNKVGSWEVR